MTIFPKFNPALEKATTLGQKQFSSRMEPNQGRYRETITRGPRGPNAMRCPSNQGLEEILGWRKT